VVEWPKISNCSIMRAGCGVNHNSKGQRRLKKAVVRSGECCSEAIMVVSKQKKTSA
jgi:hypothetical protein